jgi:predicted Ser/Thr protein kinase
MQPAELFSAEQLVELERELIEVLRAQGLIIEEIKLIGLKGSGYHSTVFSILINNVHHVLKVYREPVSFEREAKHLHKVIPKDRFLFVWNADDNRYGLNFVIIEVPDGAEMHLNDLTHEVSVRLAAATTALHALRLRKKVSMNSLGSRIEGMRTRALKHAENFPELAGVDLAGYFNALIEITKTRSDVLRVRRARIHGDLWWANIIVATEDVYLIDWEYSRAADFMEDLAWCRVLFHFERKPYPQSFWPDEQVDVEATEKFMEELLTRYEKRFPKRDIRFRYGFYALIHGLTFFSAYYLEEKHATPEAVALLGAGMREFDRYCRPQLENAST